MKTRFVAVTCILLGFILLPAHAQMTMQAGVQLRSEWNAYHVTQSDGASTRHLNGQPDIAYGIVLSQYFKPRFFGECAFNFTKARYEVNQTVGSSVFQKANIRFIQTNLNFGYHLFSNKKINPYVFGGMQFLHRRWGEEYYLGSLIQDSRWPNQRLLIQSGLGIAFPVAEKLHMRLFAGLRHNLHQSLIYDTPMNQIFTGFALLAAWQSNPKPNYVKCPKF